MLDKTQERAGGCSPKCSLKTELKPAKSRASSSHTPQRTTVLLPISRLAEDLQEIANRGLSLRGNVAGHEFPIDHWNLT
jgi:hypothetical protein